MEHFFGCYLLKLISRLFACAFVLFCLLVHFGLAVLQELARQIKVYQERINELSEKSHELAERGADLGDLCVRKLFHTGYRDTTVSELVDALNAPLEPYVSPLSSPRSPCSSLKYHYENPLKFHRSTDGHLHTLSGDDSYVRNGTEGESDFLARSLPSFGLKTPPSKTDIRGLRKYSGKGGASPIRDGLALSPTDSGVNVSSHGSGLSDLRSLGNLPQNINIENMEVATSVPKSYATFPSKRAHSEERESGSLPSKHKSLKSNESLESASVKSGSTDDPGSAASNRLDAGVLSSRHPPYGSIKSSADKETPSWKKTDNALPGRDGKIESPLERIRVRQQGTKYEPSKQADGKADSNKSMTPDEMKSLQARKLEALTPYRSKYYHIAAVEKDSGDEKPKFEGEFESLANDFDKPGPNEQDTDIMQAESEEPVFSRYGFKSWKPRSGSHDSKIRPMKAEHGKFSQLASKDEKPLDRSRSASPRSGRDSDSSPDYSSAKGRKSYQPRSPSPLTADSQDETAMKYKQGLESPRGSSYKSGIPQWTDRDTQKSASAPLREQKLGRFKSGSHGAIPSLTVSSASGSPISRFSSGDAINKPSWSVSAQGGREDQDWKSQDSRPLSTSLTTQGMKTLFSKTDKNKPGYGLLQPGQRDMVGG